MDKVVAKHALRDAGIPTPDFYAFNQTAFEELGAARALPAIEERLEFPIVVKPAGQGSALGIKFARTAADVPNALIAAFSYDTKVLLERFIDGRDLYRRNTLRIGDSPRQWRSAGTRPRSVRPRTGRSAARPAGDALRRQLSRRARQAGDRCSEPGRIRCRR
jgi:biotin carboxylase